MAFCKNCGTQLQEDKKFCASCGAAVPQDTQQQGQQQSQSQPGQQQAQLGYQQGTGRMVNYMQSTKDETVGMDSADIEKNKVYGGLAYFLFFLPLICCPESKYGRFHANQGLLLLILSVGGGIVSAVLSAIFGAIRLWYLGSIIYSVVGLAVVVLGVIGLINGFSGKAKELPIVGGIRIIK